MYILLNSWKENQVVLGDFLHSNFKKSDFGNLQQGCNLGKASRDAYNGKGRLILLDLLKKWVAKGVTSEVYDFTSQERIECTKPKELLSNLYTVDLCKK